MPFGGAGPLHAARVAEELGIDTVVVPTNAGVLSAAGLLMSDYVHYRARTERTRLDADAIDTVRDRFDGLRDEATQYLRSAGVSEELTYQHILEMRYVGQAFEVSVPLGGDLPRPHRRRHRAAFSEAHHRVFEFSKPPGDPVEIVSFRIGARARTDEFPVYQEASSGDLGEGEDRYSSTSSKAAGPALQADAAPRIGGTDVAGPVLVEDGTSTIYVPPGWRARRDEADSLILSGRREAHGSIDHRSGDHQPLHHCRDP